MTKANECTCPSGDGSLRHPCPAHPALVEQAGGDERAAFRPAQVISYRPGVGEVTIYVAGRVPGYMNIGDTVYVSDRAPVEQPIAALAQPSPKCVKCGGTGEADSGGVHPWGEPVLIPCDCETEQAEAERPEVVASVVHSNPVVLGQCGPLNANDELMTVAQHAASVARWAEMFSRVVQQRDAALVEVERLRESKGDPVGSLEKCMKVMYERDEHAKRLEAALARVAELEKELAMARDAAAKGDAARQQCGGMEMDIEELRAELAELRARVVVVPDAANDRRKSAHYCRGWNACLDELARINGLTVSEGLLRRLCEPLLSHADYVVARNELRALFNEDKENGNG